MHFGVFVIIAFTAIYRDWVPFIVVAAAIAVHHVLFCYLQHHGYGVWGFREMDDHWLKVVLHASYVIAETIFFLIFTRSVRKDVAIGDMKSRYVMWLNLAKQLTINCHEHLKKWKA